MTCTQLVVVNNSALRRTEAMDTKLNSNIRHTGKKNRRVTQKWHWIADLYTEKKNPEFDVEYEYEFWDSALPWPSYHYKLSLFNNGVCSILTALLSPASALPREERMSADSFPKQRLIIEPNFAILANHIRLLGKAYTLQGSEALQSINSNFPLKSQMVQLIPVRTCLSVKDKNPQTYSSFSIPTEMTGKSLYHLLSHTRPTRRAGI